MITVIYFDGDLIEEPDLSYGSQDTLLSQLVEQVIAGATADLTEDIDIVLIDNDELFDYWEAPEDSLGFHAINSGAFESVDEDCLSARHRIVIMVSEDALKQRIETSLALDSDDCRDHRYDYVMASLVTITHELSHCLEFIKNSNGLTPSEAQNAYEDAYGYADEDGEANESGPIVHSVDDLATGHGILFAFDENRSQEEVIAIMEDRVEEKGIEWLHNCKIDGDLMAKVIEHYSPPRLSLMAKNREYIEEFIRNDNHDFFSVLGTKLVEFLEIRKDTDCHDRFTIDGSQETVISVAKTLLCVLDESGFDLTNNLTGERIAEAMKMHESPAQPLCYLTSEGAQSAKHIAESVQRFIAETIAETIAIDACARPGM